jgi:uncharacterized protein YggE
LEKEHAMITRRALALAAIVGLFTVSTSSVAAQSTPSDGPTIDAAGYGVATAPAEEAMLQFLVMSNQGFGMGGGFENMPMMDEGTPVSEMPSMGSMGGSMTLTAGQLQPIIDALVTGGVAEADITVSIPAATSVIGPGGPAIGEVRATIQQPSGDLLPALVQSVYDASAGAGVQVFHAGARYEPADCAALIQAARDAAVADARQRAEGLARSLEVELGELVHASEPGFFGPTGAGSCSPAGYAGVFGPYGPGTENAFDPHQTEASVAMQVILTFAVAPAA